MVELEQLFWGHDGARYRLLGASSQTHAGDVDRIRDKLGTPDGLSELKPFLVSVPAGDLLIMMCGQRGKPDNIGRKTLFFHTLIGDREECVRHHVNAYSLWQAGYFKSECPDSAAVEALSVPQLPETTGSNAEPPWDGEKLAIRSNAPENESLCRMLGDRINDVPWAGFTWNPLDDFQLYAISRYTEPPTDRPYREGNKETRPSPVKASSGYPASVSGEAKDGKMKTVAVILGILLLISLGFNVWFASRQTRQPVQPSARRASFDFKGRIKRTKAIYDIYKNEDNKAFPEDVAFLQEIEGILTK